MRRLIKQFLSRCCLEPRASVPVTVGMLKPLLHKMGEIDKTVFELLVTAEFFYRIY
ncbi:hypothetical protein HMPREF9554_02030 [Treponema phagedenis F0421]|nr:hypothetical protein HMPREF9554_02030 [Treponema phagedenis F0421]